MLELNAKGFSCLDKLKNLSSLTLSLSKSGPLLANCRSLMQLSALDIRYCTTLSPVLEKLIHSHELKTLCLDYVNLSEADCKRIATIKNLEALRLYHLQLSDQKLEYLSSAQKLQQLSLKHCTGLTPACRSSLLKMKSLKNLDLPEQIFSLNQINELRRLRPNLKVAELFQEN